MIIAVINKLEDEMIARLSELSEQKIGQLTFYFAQEKLEDFHNEVGQYRKFMQKNHFNEKRNQMISHKMLPEKWTDFKDIDVSSKLIGIGIGKAVGLMWKIDEKYLGPSAKYLWREALKKKDELVAINKVKYLLLPHLKLSVQVRKKIIVEEFKAGYPVWEKVTAKVNGVERDVIICKKWGALFMDKNSAFIMDDYPLINQDEINFTPKE